MHIRQLSLFPEKESFDYTKFESSSNIEFFTKVAVSLSLAFEKFKSFDIVSFDKTTRSNMLNNLVVSFVAEHASSSNFSMIKSLTNTRRQIGLLGDEYIILFKKSPVRNAKTNQDDLIKFQSLNRHVLILTYSIDDFWNSITRLEFQYFISRKDVAYTYDITHLMSNTPVEIENEAISKIPKVTLKPKKISKKDSKTG